MRYTIKCILNQVEIGNAYLFKEDMQITIGRSANNSIVLNESYIGNQHLIIFSHKNKVYIKDYGSTNGTFVNNLKIQPEIPIEISEKSTVFLSSLKGVELKISKIENDDSELIYQDFSKSIIINSNFNKEITDLFKNKNVLIIGRSNSCDVILDNVFCSREHAKITFENSMFYIEDLKSLNGTFVNGTRINKRVKISENDDIILGRVKISLDGSYIDISKEVAIKTLGLEKKFTNGKIGLHKLNLEISTNSLLAVMGPSGCGKSTLLKALNGESPCSSGVVYIGGLELNKNFEYLKTQIGYVPQDDIVHKELTVYQSLWYSAKLRLPHISDQTIKDKIQKVLTELNIIHIKDNLVSAISGGQRKRVSIAVEILTDPLILFLDEPTSPLDPQTIEDFLSILKRLSTKGTTVIMVTHKPEDLAYMDQVIFMAEGGHICYFGNKDEYLNYFGVKNTVNVYSLLVDENKKDWIKKYEDTHKSKEITSLNQFKNRSKINYVHQFFWLSIRYLNIKVNDKINSTILLLQAPFIALIICLLFDSISQGVPFLMAISSIWLGTNNAAREIIGESSIFKRERMFNQSIFTYLLSKTSILLLFSIVQSIIFVTIIYYNFSDTKPTFNSPILVVLWMVFISFTSTLLGLLLSSIVSSSEKVMSLVPLTLIPQIMFAGIITSITNNTMEVLSYFSISRWANEGFTIIQEKITIPKMDILNKADVCDQKLRAAPIFGKILDKQSNPIDSLANGYTELKKQFHISYIERFETFAGTLKLDFIVMSILSLLFLVGIYYSLKAKDSVKIK